MARALRRATTGCRAYDATTLTAEPRAGRLLRGRRARARRGEPRSSPPTGCWARSRAALNQAELDIDARAGVAPARSPGCSRASLDGTISGKIAKDVFDAMWAGEGGDADAIIAARGLTQISDDGAIEKLVDDVLAANAGDRSPSSAPARRRPSTRWSARR
ncbi:MAG: hypothetical protein MZW92_44255 [Comamonadaceae bacterium]|nr:hypothetical protein [Comamonadaceae bacterium]